MRYLVTAALLVSAVSTVVVGLETPANAATSLTVLGPNVTVRGDAAVPPGAGEAAVTVARNEFESFQVAVEPTTTISNLVVQASDLAGPGDSVLPAGNLTVYREGYVGVTADTRSDGESTVGQWPDVLIPEKDYIYGQDRAAFHAPVSAGSHAVIWVDVLAPLGQTPGVYTGSMAVLDGATVVGTVPVSVTVRSFALPSTSTLKNAFFTMYSQPCIAHTGHFACNWDSAQAWKLSAEYARVGLENRVTISNPWPVHKAQTLTNNSYGENFTAAFRSHVLPLVNGSATPAGDGSQLRLPGAELTTLGLYGPSAGEAVSTACATACVTAWKSEATTDGILNRFFYYTCDEPYLSAARWGECATAHTQVGQASGLPELVTSTYQQGHDPALGNGADSWVDIFVPQAKQMANKPGYQWAGNQRATYDTWLTNTGDGQPNQVWMYSACDTAGCNGPTSAEQDPTWNSTYWNGWPGYAIDEPASQARAMSWLAFEYDATGELFWHTTWGLDKAWSACTSATPETSSDCLYYSGMMGDGTLFYPGLACPVGSKAGCIGGTTDIPLESMRLKRIRDGREDYEYLNLLAKNAPADDSFAHDTALSLFGPTLDSATYSTSVTQADLDNARDALGDKLDATPHPPSVSVADVTLNEKARTGFATLRRTGDTSSTSAVHAMFVDGTAHRPGDYTATDTHVTFDPGDTTKTVPFKVTDDAVHEGTEAFHVRLSAHSGAVVGDGTATITIVDNDPAPVTYKVDTSVRRPLPAPQVGVGVYNATGSRQTITVNAKRRQTVTLRVRVQNRGSGTDSMAILGSKTAKGFVTTYLAGSRDVTGRVVRGKQSTGTLASGSSRIYAVRIKVKKGTKVGVTRTWAVQGVSSRSPRHVRDVVKIKVRVTR